MKLGESKKQALILSSKLTGSNVLLQFVAFPLGIVKARILGPYWLGALKIFDLIKSYSSYSQLGLLQALVRQVPIAMSKKNHAESRLIQDIVFSFNIVVTSITIIILWGIYFCGIDFKGILNLFRLIILTATLVLNRLDLCLNSYMKAIGNFQLITRRTILISWIAPFLIVGLVIPWKLDGAIVGALIVAVIGVGIYLKELKTFQYQWNLSWRKLLSFFSIGFKVFINKLIDSISYTLGTTIIAILLAPKFVGIYGFAMDFIFKSSMVLSMFTIMVYRHMLDSRGKHGLTKGISFLKPYIQNTMSGLLVLSTSFIVFLYFLCHLVVNLFLQKYTEALICLPVLALGQIFFVSSILPSFCMNVSDQLEKRFFITAFFLALHGILDVILIRMGYGILGAAWGFTVSFILYGIILNYIVRRQINQNFSEPILYILKFSSISIITFALMSYFGPKELISFSLRSPLYLKAAYAGFDMGIKALIVIGFVIICYCAFFWKDKLANECWSAVNFIILRAKISLFNISSERKASS